MQNQFVNADGTPMTPKQIQDYYDSWNKYYQQNPHLIPENIAKQQSAYSYSQAVQQNPKPVTAPQHNPFANSPFVTTQKMSALEAARSSGKAAAVSTTPVVQQPPKWPPSLKAYVQKVFQSNKSGKKSVIEGKLKKLIALATDSNSLWTVPWDRVELPNPDTPLEDLPSLVPQQNHQATPVFQNPTTTSTKKKKRATPIIPDEPLPKFAKLSAPEIPKAVQKLQPEILTVAQSDLGIDKKEERKRRFEQEQKEALKKMKKRQVIGPSPVQARPLISMDTSNPDNIDWNDYAIVGTCAELEKPYLRLTSAPDPSTVRPLQILKKTLEMLKSRWKKEHNYTFVCDQFKSLRQDLTVQRIKNEFTVKVYETHSRIAIEKGDLGEFNQCSAQLKQLYSIYKLDGCEDEFTAYRILYMIHTKNRRDLVELISSIKNPGPAVKHALLVRSAWSAGDYHSFFKLYHSCPNMSAYLMDQFLERERLSSFLKLCRAYRPTLAVDFFSINLGFCPPGKEISKIYLRDTFSWIRSCGVQVSKGDIDCKAATAVLSQKVADLESLGVDIKGQIH